jgi:HEAT repeat protein
LTSHAPERPFLLRASHPGRQPAEEERDLPADTEAALPSSTVDLGWRDGLLARFAGLPDGDRKDALRELRNLARLGDARALELLRRGLDDASAGVRARALSQLSELEDPALLQALPQAILDSSDSVREAAAQALGRLPAEQSGPLLASLLLDSDDEVLLEAMQSVERLGYEEARPRLAELVQASDLDVAARAARTLEKMGDRSGSAAVVGRLLEHMARADVAGRVRDVKRLRQLHASAELHGILESDASPTVRFEAQKALADLES